MEGKGKALLLGDIANPAWHPVKGIDDEIRRILSDCMTVDFSEDYGTLTVDDLHRYDLCICYADRWKEKTSPQLVNAVLTYISGGGALLAIHNGIFMQNNYELAQMLGARFTGHPPYEKLSFCITAPEHPIVEGMEAFEMEEEPYRFELDPFTEKTEFLQYRHEGQCWPAGWAHEFGLGRVVYLAPGHDVKSFQQLPLRSLVLRSSLWAVRQL
jgi:uncharacterized protein